MGKRKMWELAQLKEKAVLCALCPSTASHSSRLMPSRAASSVPWAGLRDRSLAPTNQPHGAAEPSTVLLISETRNIGQAPFLKHSVQAEAFVKSWSLKARLWLILCYAWSCLRAGRSNCRAHAAFTPELSLGFSPLPSH